MSKLATEYQGFLRFINRAKNEIDAWFGPHCNNDPNKITFMAAREWNVMAYEERRNFITVHNSPTDGDLKGTTRKANAYLCYLLHKRYMSIPAIVNNYINSSNDETTTSEQNKSLSVFDRRAQKFNSQVWKSMSQKERDEYRHIRIADLCMNHVIQARNYLHQLYEPKDLALLEFILKSNPKKPLDARAWYFKLENLSLKSIEAIEKWQNMAAEEKRFYEICAELDKKRYIFEKKFRLTKLLALDTTRDDLILPEFQSQRAIADVEALSSIVGADRNLTPATSTRKPPNAFALFFSEFRDDQQEDENRKMYQENLKIAAAAWMELDEESKQIYKERSLEMKESAKLDQLPLIGSKSINFTTAMFKSKHPPDGPSKPSQLLPKKVPSPMDIFGAHKELSVSKRKSRWDSLSQASKLRYTKEHKALCMELEEEKLKMAEKQSHVKELIEKSKELETLKLKLFLIRSKTK